MASRSPPQKQHRAIEPSCRATASTVLAPAEGGMKVSIVFQSSREVIRGDIELKDLAKVADLQEAIYAKNVALEMYENIDASAG
ncbi:hypothetical protein GUJ93_ZPchr0004g39783 [Zizania palustris]|uniref:Uncharacterized protein n=1 Tax=Zizania palustris TaxID=103762 RepID=A0A8J5T094_ZIZPA|nr:hypothetical protein GUJ93_ZPchr0004g39783 [Zizania palustris]